MSNKLHEDVKKYVIAVLRHYGFNAQPEYWIMNGERRIDCAAWCADEKLCGNHSVGVEVSRTSDLAKDIETLTHSPFDLKFVISLKAYESPHIEGIYVVEPDLFESTLRYILKIPQNYPMYGVITEDTLRKVAMDILREIGRKPQEIVNTPEFEQIIKETFAIYKDVHGFSEMNELIRELEDTLKEHFGVFQEKSEIKTERRERKIMSYKDIPPEGTNNNEWEKALANINEFKKSIEMAGFPHFVDKSAEILLRAYSSNGILIKEVIRPNVAYGISQTINHVPPQLYNLLETLGYLYESGNRGRYENGKSFFAYLTPKGMEIAKSLALKVLKDKKEFIDDQISLNGEIFSLMACIADMPKGGLIGGIEISRDPLLGYQLGENYKRIIRHVPTEKESYISSLLYGIWKPSDFSQEFTKRAKYVGVPLNLELFFESSTRLPKIKRKIIEFWFLFVDEKLAFIEPHFSSHGEHYGDFIHPIPSVVDYIIDKTRDKVLEKLDPQLIEKLNAINTIYTIQNLYNTEWKHGLEKNVTLEDVLRITGVSKEYIEELVEEMYQKGISGKLVDQHPYLIVLDDEKFKEYLVEKLKDVEDDILSFMGN